MAKVLDLVLAPVHTSRTASRHLEQDLSHTRDLLPLPQHLRLTKSPPSSLPLLSIPFPVAQAHPSAAQITAQTVAQFLLSPQHSQIKSRKLRLKEAMLRWHPDKFDQKWINKVPESQRAAVKECVGATARSLSALMEREKDGSRSA